MAGFAQPQQIRPSSPRGGRILFSFSASMTGSGVGASPATHSLRRPAAPLTLPAPQQHCALRFIDTTKFVGARISSQAAPQQDESAMYE